MAPFLYNDLENQDTLIIWILFADPKVSIIHRFHALYTYIVSYYSKTLALMLLMVYASECSIIFIN